MRLRILAPQQIVRLKSRSFTYPDVGATAADAAPPGYHQVTRTRLLPAGRNFEEASERLLSWHVQRGAGLRVAVSAPTVAAGEVVLMHVAILPIPCRVVHVVDEPDRCGFAYGTLPGHPESGEESFMLRRRPDGRVEFTITSFSRPATLLARVGGPAARLGQRLVTTRYLRTLDR